MRRLQEVRFGRINNWVVKVLTCSRTISPGRSITFKDARRWISISDMPFCAWSTAHAHSPTRTRHRYACSGGGGYHGRPRRTFGRGSVVCTTRVLNELPRNERGDEDSKNGGEGLEGKRVGICMWEQGCKVGKEDGGLGSEDRRREGGTKSMAIAHNWVKCR